MNAGPLKLAFNLFSLGLALALALAISRSRAPEDPLFSHLAAGRAIAAQGGFPEADPFYFSQPASAPFDKQAWLFNLGAYALQDAAGFKALRLARSALLLAAFFFIVAACFRRGAPPFPSAVFALWALAAANSGAGLDGPRAFSLCFFSACLYVMEGEFWDAFFSRWVWLPLLAAAWANIDGAALVLIPLAWLWAFFDRPGPGAPAPNFPLLARLSTLALVSASLFLHPLLLKLPLSVLDFHFHSPFEPQAFPAAAPALLLMAASALVLLASLKVEGGGAHRGRDLALFAFLGPGSLVWSALLPYFCLWAAPMAARRCGAVAAAFPQALAPVLWIIKASALGLGLWKTPQALASLAALAERPAAQPRETLRLFKDEMLSGNVFAEPAWSGRLAWELDGAKVYARPGLRGREAQDMEVALSAQGRLSPSALAAWEAALERMGADYALLRPSTPLAKAMARSAHWQPIDFDNASVLHAKVRPDHAGLIKARAPRGLRPGDWEEPFDSSRLPQVEADLEARLTQRPKLGVLYYFQGLMWRERGREATARSWLEKGIKADPAFAPNYRLLGELRLKAGDKEGARAFLEKAAELERP